MSTTVLFWDGAKSLSEEITGRDFGQSEYLSLVAPKFLKKNQLYAELDKAQCDHGLTIRVVGKWWYDLNDQVRTTFE